MTKMKKLMALFLCCAMLLSLIACAPGEEPLIQETSAGPLSHRITLRTAGGMAMSGIDVYIYADSACTDMVCYGETDEDGMLTMELEQNDEYVIVLSEVPRGYDVAEYYRFTDLSADIVLTSDLITGESLSGAALGVGDVMYDFSVVTPAGETVTLSEMLNDKKMVLLNFWYTTCTYCVEEFPFMEEAYQQYSDDVGIIALNPLDDDMAISLFQSQYGLTFPMAACQPAWSGTFGISGYPTSIVVDRYGVICLVEAGGITSLRPFTSIFEHFTAGEYQQTLYSSLSELVTTVKPTFTMAPSDEIAAVLGTEELDITYRPEEGDDAEYSWPFIIGEKNGERCIYPSNQAIEGSYAILYADVYLEAGQALGFDYLASTEKGCDILHIIVDDEQSYSISGMDEVEQWRSCYPLVAEKDGYYEVAFCYLKDTSDNYGDDTVYLKNLRIVDVEQIDTATYLPRQAAATEDNIHYEYVDIVFNESDGYYHVAEENGPLLLANLMGYTQFNEEKTVWDLTYYGDVTRNGASIYDEIVDYCSYASNSALNGYCTVDRKLAELLMLVDEQAGFDSEDEREWLRICQYYEAYGTDEQLVDPIKGLAAFCAFDAKLGRNVESNYFYYDRPIMPRGLLAKFVPAKSGVYRITSRNDSEHGVDGWIFDENRENAYTYELVERMYNDDLNVSMLYYMEAGKDYYIDIAFWDIYEIGYIYYDIEYVAPSYELFRLGSPGYFTYDTNATGEMMYHLIAGGVNVILGEDGYYYEDLGLDEKGNRKYGSLIYCDFTGITGLFSNPIATVNSYNQDGSIQLDANGEPVMIKGMIELGGFDFSKTENDLYIISLLNARDQDVEATDEYLRTLWGEDYDHYAEAYRLEDVYAGIYHGSGEDLTEEISAYLDQIIVSGPEERHGCVPVSRRLAEILQLLMDKYTFQDVDHSWTKLCYYYQYLGPEK